MKIAYVVTDPGIPVYGSKGASIHVRAITGALDAMGHYVRVFAANVKGEISKEDRISCDVVGDPGRVKKRWRWLKRTIPVSTETDASHPDREGEKKARRTISEIMRLDAVGRCARDITKYLSEEPADLILERLSPFGAAGMIAAEELGIPRIVEMNAPLTEESRAWRGLELEELSRLIEAAALERADGVIAVSRELEARLRTMSIEKNRLLHLPNGVDCDLFSPGPRDPSLSRALGLDGKLVIGFSGSLKQWHGVDILVRAFSALAEKHPETALLIVGDGPSREHLEALSRDSGRSERIIFTGAIPYRRVPSYLRMMDVAVAPYNVEGEFYFSPLKVMEYLACGRPVVATGRGEIARIIVDGENGLLLSAVEPDCLREKLTSLLRDRSLRSKLGENGRESAEKCSWNERARKLTHFIEMIIASR